MQNSFPAQFHVQRVIDGTRQVSETFRSQFAIVFRDAFAVSYEFQPTLLYGPDTRFR